MLILHIFAFINTPSQDEHYWNNIQTDIIW